VSKNDMVKEVDKWELPYEERILERVRTLLRDQADKYRYMLQ